MLLGVNQKSDPQILNPSSSPRLQSPLHVPTIPLSKMSSDFVDSNGYVRELFFSAGAIESTRALVMAEARSAGFVGDLRSHPHWSYVRNTVFCDDKETLANTSFNARRFCGEMKSEQKKKMHASANLKHVRFGWSICLFMLKASMHILNFCCSTLLVRQVCVNLLDVEKYQNAKGFGGEVHDKFGNKIK